MPNTELLESGKDSTHVVTSWDIIAGDVKPADSILIYDESGDHAALQAAEVAANAGAKVEIMTPDRTFSAGVMAMNLVPYMRSLQDKDTTFHRRSSPIRSRAPWQQAGSPDWDRLQ